MNQISVFSKMLAANREMAARSLKVEKAVRAVASEEVQAIERSERLRPDTTVTQLMDALDSLVKECEYSASSGLPFNFPEGKGHWTQLGKAKALLASLRQTD